MSEAGRAAARAKMRDAGVSDAAIEVFSSYYDQLGSGATGMIRESEIEPFTDAPVLEPDAPADPRALGATVITILLEWLRAIEEPMDLGFVEIPGIPGMRMVVFSLVLLAIILYRREGIMGTRELTWKSMGAFFRRGKA